MANLAFWAFAVVYGIFSHQVIKKIGESKDWYVSKAFDPLGKNKVFVIQQIFKISLIGFQLLFHRYSWTLGLSSPHFSHKVLPGQPYVFLSFECPFVLSIILTKELVYSENCRQQSQPSCVL